MNKTINELDLKNLLMKLNGLDSVICPCGEPFHLYVEEIEAIDLETGKVSTGTGLRIARAWLCGHQRPECLATHATTTFSFDSLETRVEGGGLSAQEEETHDK